MISLDQKKGRGGLALTVALSILASCAAIFIAHQYFSRALVDQQAKALESMAMAIDLEVLKFGREAAARLAEKQPVREVATSGAQPDNRDILLVLDAARAGMGASLVYVMNLDGLVVACTPYDDGKTLTGNNYEFRPYFTSAKRGLTEIYPALGVTTNERGLYASAPIFGGDDGEVVGVMVLKMSLDGIDRLLISHDSPAVMVSPDWVVFSSNRGDWLFRLGKQHLSMEEKTRLRGTAQFANRLLEHLSDETDLSNQSTLIDGVRHHLTSRQLGIRDANSGLYWRLISAKDASSRYPLGAMAVVVAACAIGSATSIALSRTYASHKKLAAAAAERNQYLAVTLNSIGDAVVSTDTRGVLTHMNRVAEELTGWSCAEAIGKPLAEVFNIVNSKTGEPAANPVERVLATGKIVGLANHTMLISRDGKERQIADSASSILDNQSKIVGVVLIFRDVSEEYRVVEENSRHQKLLDTIMETLPVPIFHKNRQGIYVGANKAFTDFIGKPLADVVGKTVFDLAPLDAARRYMSQDLELFDRPGRQTYEWVAQNGQGHNRDVVFHKASIPDTNAENGVSGLVGCFIDVTPLKEAQRHLLEFKEQLQTILDSLDAVVYVADMQTHEILFVNRHTRKFAGECVGKKCWETLQKGLTGPCPFCNNEQLLDAQGKPVGVIRREFQNTKSGRWYECHDQVIKWVDGRMVRLEVAIDVTERKLAEVNLGKIKPSGENA